MDNTTQKGRRKRMIHKLKTLGFHNEKILRVINSIPRHEFIDSAFIDHAYELKSFPIGDGQTISNPMTVAIQTYFLNIQKDDKILEIGTGSGYQTAVLCKMGAKVYSVERISNLHIKAKRVLNKLDIRPFYLSYGDGLRGLPNFSPFDKILLTAGISKIPKQLLSQLKTGGIMVLPKGAKELKLHVIHRISENNFKNISYPVKLNFVPVLPKKM